MISTAKEARAVLCVITVSMMLSACDDLDVDQKLLTTAVTWNQVGYSADQWLEQHSSVRNQWDRVALIFGFGDDYEGCTDVAEALSVKFPLSRYRCVPAN